MMVACLIVGVFRPHAVDHHHPPTMTAGAAFRRCHVKQSRLLPVDAVLPSHVRYHHRLVFRRGAEIASWA